MEREKNHIVPVFLRIITVHSVISLRLNQEMFLFQKSSHVVSHMFKHPAFFKFLKVHYKPPTFAVCWGKTGCGYVRVSSTGKLSDLPVFSSPVKPCFYSSQRMNRKAVFNCIVCAACWLNVLLSVACWVLLRTASSAFVTLFTSWHASAEFDRRLEKNPLVLKALCNFEWIWMNFWVNFAQ